MNILVIGDVVSAQFLAKRLATEDGVQQVYHAWANDNTQPEGKYVPIYDVEKKYDRMDPQRTDFIARNLHTYNVDLIVAVELPAIFCQSLRDRAEKLNIPCMFPTKQLARLEWSRLDFRTLVKNTIVKVPHHRQFKGESIKSAYHMFDIPFVLKYDKTWMDGEQTKIVTHENHAEVYKLVSEPEYNKADFLVDPFIKGYEYSYHALVSSSDWKFLGASRDYKKKYNDERGPNTNGMGAYGPVQVNPLVHDYVDIILDRIKKVYKRSYVGFLYLGIITGDDGVPVVLEMNARPGCPELQTIIPSINNNLAVLFMAAATGGKMEAIRFNNKKTVSVVLPEHETRGSHFYQSCDLQRNTCTISKMSVEEARDEVYASVRQIPDIDESKYRTDIGYLK